MELENEVHDTQVPGIETADRRPAFNIARLLLSAIVGSPLGLLLFMASLLYTCAAFFCCIANLSVSLPQIMVVNVADSKPLDDPQVSRNPVVDFLDVVFRWKFCCADLLEHSFEKDSRHHLHACYGDSVSLLDEVAGDV